MKTTQYTYTFTDKKQINKTTQKMASVTVYTLTGKEIGAYAWSRLSSRSKEQDIQNMISILIREHELKIAFSKMNKKINCKGGDIY